MIPTRTVACALVVLASNSVSGAAFSQVGSSAKGDSENSWSQDSSEPVPSTSPTTPPASGPSAEKNDTKEVPAPPLPESVAPPAPEAAPRAQPVVLGGRTAGPPNATGQRDRASEPPTLLGRSGRTTYGGFGGVSVAGSRIARESGILVGGSAGMIIDHRFSWGIAGKGLASEIPGRGEGEASLLGFGYGGFHFGFDLLMDAPVFFSVGALIGAGGIGLMPKNRQDWGGHPSGRETVINGFFVAEPSLALNANLTCWMRLGVEASYRWVSGVQLPNYSDGDFRGISIGGHLQFGRF